MVYTISNLFSLGFIAFTIDRVSLYDYVSTTAGKRQAAPLTKRTEPDHVHSATSPTHPPPPPQQSESSPPHLTLKLLFLISLSCNHDPHHPSPSSSHVNMLALHPLTTSSHTYRQRAPPFIPLPSSSSRSLSHFLVITTPTLNPPPPSISTYSFCIPSHPHYTATADELHTTIRELAPHLKLSEG